MMAVVDQKSVFFILLCVIKLNAVRYPETIDDVSQLFGEWQTEYGKHYEDDTMKVDRFFKFYENLKSINNLNDLYRSKTEFRLNQFADMSASEFKSKVLMRPRKSPQHPPDTFIHSRVEDPLPKSFDWSDKGVVTSIKDQGTVGTCWAFSAIGNIEGQWALMGKPLTNLSVELLVDCDGTEDVKDGEADCGVFGGWPFLAFQFISKLGGLETWDDYAYCSGSGKCFPCPAPGYNKTLCGPPESYCLKNQSCAAKLNTSKFVPELAVASWAPVDKNETVIAEQLMKLGPLSVALNAGMLQFYHSGVFDPPFCDPTDLDHAVLLVGFGEEKTVFGTRQYWKVKNSWGHKWGEKGYFRIKRGDGKCGINTQVVNAFLAKQ